MSVRGFEVVFEVVEDDWVKLVIALSADQFDEVFVLLKLHIGIITL
jgi:hypothetical protein